MSRNHLLRRMALSVTALLLLPLSLFAETRPRYVTNLRGTPGVRLPYSSAQTARSGSLDGIVRDVGRGGREIVVQTRYGMQRVTVSKGTRVNYGGRQYRVTDLDRGDRVRISFAGKSRHAKRIDVLQSAGDYGYDNRNSRYPDQYRNRAWGDYTATVYGTVQVVDQRNDVFRLRTDAGRTLTVDGRSAPRGYVDQLRPGVRVTVRGTLQNDNVFRASDIRMAANDSWRDRQHYDDRYHRDDD